MHRIVIAGSFSEYNQTRRMCIARINPDGTLDTSYGDTAYNQFVGLPKYLSNDPLQTINVVTMNTADAGILIGGNFDEIGVNSTGFENPVMSRRGIAPLSNVAKLKGGQTWGPGAVELDQAEYSLDEKASSGSITMRRKNGGLGSASVNFITDVSPETKGIALGGDFADINDPENEKNFDFVNTNKINSRSR